MKAKITSTSQIVAIKAVGFDGQTQARVWECVTDSGVPFVAYIPLVQVRRSEDCTQFETELTEHKQPDPETWRAIDLRHF